jgi:hypothetical protein
MTDTAHPSESPSARLRRIALSIFLGLAGTIAALGIYLGAINADQPTVNQPAVPLVQVAPERWDVHSVYNTTVGPYAVTIYPGQPSDLASIPRPLWGKLGLSNASPCLVRAAFVHDHLYPTMLPDGSGGVTTNPSA